MLAWEGCPQAAASRQLLERGAPEHDVLSSLFTSVPQPALGSAGSAARRPVEAPVWEDPPAAAGARGGEEGMEQMPLGPSRRA